MVAYNDDNDIAALSARPKGGHRLLCKASSGPCVGLGVRQPPCGGSGAIIAGGVGFGAIVHQDSYFTRRFRSYAERQTMPLKGRSTSRGRGFIATSAAVAVQKERRRERRQPASTRLPRGLSPPPRGGTRPRAVIVEGHVIATDADSLPASRLRGGVRRNGSHWPGAVLAEGTHGRGRDILRIHQIRMAASDTANQLKMFWLGAFPAPHPTEADAKSSGKGEEAPGVQQGEWGECAALWFQVIATAAIDPPASWWWRCGVLACSGIAPLLVPSLCSLGRIRKYHVRLDVPPVPKAFRPSVGTRLTRLDSPFLEQGTHSQGRSSRSSGLDPN